ncbi:hypothetical protein [Pseudomonas orientalis]|uniref:hypothetical protein n=1 Tax=Pseudomonas orientalis TaxID=76758 RepID=UPI0030D82E27
MSSLVGNPIPLVTTKAGFPVPLPVNIVRVVAKAIKHAWKEIEANPSAHLLPKGPAAPEEDVYTDAICNMLDQMLASDEPIIDGFTSDYFHTVCRGEGLPNFSGVALNKQPDLIIRLANSPLVDTRRLVGVFIESKVVTMSKPITKYTTDGLSRFVVGDYGWAMQAGIMLAYQKNKHRAASCLEAQLALETGLLSVPGNGAHLESRPEHAPITGFSSHDRTWLYKNGDKPGAIRVWHIWDLHTPEVTTP